MEQPEAYLAQLHVQTAIQEAAARRFPDYFGMAVADVVNMGIMSEADAEAMQRDTLASALINRGLRDMLNPLDPADSRTALAQVRQGGSLNEIYDLTEATLRGAGTMAQVAYDISDQAKQHREDGVPAKNLPLVKYLQNQGRLPYRTAIETSSVARCMLSQVKFTLHALSFMLVDALPKDRKAYSNASAQIQMLYDRASEGEGGHFHVEDVDQLLMFFDEAGVAVGGLATELGLGRFAGIYKTWQASTIRLSETRFYIPGLHIAEQAAPIQVKEEAPSGPSPAELAATLAAEYQAEVDQLVAEREVAIDDFRIAPSQLRKSGLRRLATELAHVGRTNGLGMAVNEDARRLTGILRHLKHLGADPQNAKNVFETILPTEDVVAAHFAQLNNEIRGRQLPVELSRWQPLTADLETLQEQWPALQQIIQASWPDGKGVEAYTAISQALEAYNSYKTEQDHAEARLASLARRLEPVTMVPQARPEAVSLPLRQQAARAVLHNIAYDRAHGPTARQRSEVILRFMDLAASQRTPEDDELFGVLHLSEVMPETEARFFGLRFRSPDNTEWILLESFRPDQSSYVVPADVARNYNSLQFLLTDIAERKPQASAARRIPHAQDQSAGQHIDALLSALTAPANQK